jgi:hypothetical protein
VLVLQVRIAVMVTPVVHFLFQVLPLVVTRRLELLRLANRVDWRIFQVSTREFPII